MSRWYHIGGLDDIASESSVLLVSDEGHRVAVWRLADGSVRATDDHCSHYFWSLHGSGRLQGTEITCLAHEARFDVTTGASLCPPARLPLTTYEVTVDADRQVHVHV